MPILRREPDTHPDDLFDRPEVGVEAGRQWWAIHARPRSEKMLSRSLTAAGIWHYLPLYLKRSRTPSGRPLKSYVPLFPGYLFLYGNAEDRLGALRTNSIVQVLPVPDGAELTHDLRQIRRLTESGVPLVPEDQLEPGVPVRVKGGAFSGFEGVIIKRQSQDRFLVVVHYLQRGVSVSLVDCQVERIL